MRIQQLEERLARLEEKLQETSKQHAETSKQQTQAMFDLQTQIETQNTDLRKLRGQNEEVVHNQQEAEKRQKDFYVDLDTRMRHFETLEATAQPAAAPAPRPGNANDALLAEDGPALENRTYEAAYGFFKAGNHQKAISALEEFLKKFPESVHIPNVHYQMGVAYSGLNDCKSALDSFQQLLRKYSYSPHAADAMLGVATCQLGLGDKAGARKTHQQIIAKYPGSAMADTARKRLKIYK